MAELIPEEVVCRELRLDRLILRRWIEAGLVEAEVVGGRRVFDSAQVRRIWSIASLHCDLDVNLEGVQIILDLADQVRTLQGALQSVMRQVVRSRQRDRFYLQIIQEQIGPVEWEIDL